MTPYNKLTEEDVSSIVNLYYQMKSFREISEELQVSKRSIPRILVELGINTNLKNRYTLNDDYFDKIDEPEKAYWLGFIYADGYVGGEDTNSIVITLSEVDKNHLEKFKNTISYTGEIRNAGKGGFENSKNRYSINFSSKKMASDLRGLGLYPGKSTTMESMPELPKSLIRHFIRGYFDGDGSVYQQRNHSTYKNKEYVYQKIIVSMIGTRLFLEDIKSYMSFSSDFKSSRTKEVEYIRFYGVSEMKKIYRFFYKDSSVYLERKFNKFTGLLGPLVSQDALNN